MFCVVAPILATALYLWGVAQDQYASTVAFSVQTESPASPLDLFGGLADMGGTSSSDTDILFDFARSQHLVAAVQARLDLHSLWAAPDDPIFGYTLPKGAQTVTIESLRDHWARMVTTRHDPATGLITVTARAFSPEDALAIAKAVRLESANMINALSETAQRDATTFAFSEFEIARATLRDARLALTGFRLDTQMVDPAMDLQGRLGLVASLQEQLASAMLEHQTLASSERPNREFTLAQAQQRIEILRGLIAQERAAMTVTENGGVSYAAQVAEYERLKVDLAFAEEAYVAARAALDVARAEAQRTTRYLAAHIPATLAQTPEYPRRITLTALVGVAALLIWSMGTLLVQALRDRR